MVWLEHSLIFGILLVVLVKISDSWLCLSRVSYVLPTFRQLADVSFEAKCNVSRRTISSNLLAAMLL